MIVTKSEFGAVSGTAPRFMVLSADVWGTERGAQFGRTAYSARSGLDQSFGTTGGARRLRGMKAGLTQADVRLAITGGVRPVQAERGLPGFVHAATPRPQGAVGACPWSRPA
ncbi:hypothetical protein [Nocardiopsis chromatogenes]|uniref:hypothetical protein n=1 Tax=Nocardiopsis chromatogenes TaxID=280239 RepID=UPI0003638843|nr:hypothetical protein [Nocardiopsis chromatogenes]